MVYESEQIEFKRELNDKFEIDVVAFLNSKGGHIYLGISDDGTTYGIENIDEIQLEIKDRLKDKISPSPIGFFEILIEEKDDKQIAHVIIASGNEKPYYLKKFGMSPKGAYTRVGSASVQFSEKQIFNLYSKRTRTSLVNIISPLQNLTFMQLKIYYEGNGYPLRDNFYSLLNLKLESGEFNYLAYLLSDQNSLVINVGKFKGSSVYDLEEMKSFSNQSLIKTTFELIDFIETYNKSFTIIQSPTRIEKQLFDSIALREALINAMVHSDYTYENSPSFRIFDNRIEIISVGGLPEGIEKEEFLSGYMSPKNPPLMKVFRDLKLVEHMGTGIIRILEKYDPSVFSFSSNFIKVSLPFFSPDKTEDTTSNSLSANINITERQLKIINLIQSKPGLTQEKMAQLLNVSRYTIIRDLKELSKNGIVSKNGTNKPGSWQVIKI